MSVAHAPGRHIGRPHVNPWLVAVIVLAALLVGLSAWVAVDQTRSSSTEGLASPEIVAMLEDRLAALNSGDAEAIAAFYTRDAVLDDDAAGGIVTKGNAAIGAYIAGYVNQGMRLESVGPIYQWGRTVAEAVKVPGDDTNKGTDWLLLYRVQPSGKISYQWVVVASQDETDFD